MHAPSRTFWIAPFHGRSFTPMSPVRISVIEEYLQKKESGTPIGICHAWRIRLYMLSDPQAPIGAYSQDEGAGQGKFRKRGTSYTSYILPD